MLDPDLSRARERLEASRERLLAHMRGEADPADAEARPAVASGERRAPAAPVDVAGQLSLLAAPYLWVYDFAMLLAPAGMILAVFAPNRPALNAAAALIIAANIGVGLSPREMQYSTWYPLPLMLLGWLAWRQQSPPPAAP